MKILFVKLGAIGDVIQAAAAVRQFRHSHPVSRLDWLAGKNVAGLIREFGVADEVIELDENALFAAGSFRRLKSLASSVFSIAARGRTYDKIVTAYSDWRYRLLTFAVRSKGSVSFDSRAVRPSPLNNRNRVFEYWRLLVGNEKERIDVAQAMHALGDFLLPNVSLKVGLPKSFIGLVPGGAKNLLRTDGLRRWPVENYRELAHRLLSTGYPVVILGGPGDSWVSENFNGLPVVDIVGQTDLITMIHALARADAVVCHDSGPLHMAAITRTGIVALFGPTPPNAFMAMGRDKIRILHAGNRVGCCPCYDGRNYAPCSDPVCLKNISVDTVYHTLLSLLLDPSNS